MDSVPRLMQVLNHILLESSMTIRRVALAYAYTFHICLSLQERLTGNNPFIKLTFDPRPPGDRDSSLCVKHLTLLPLDEMEVFTTDLITKSVTWRECGLGQLPNLRSIETLSMEKPFLEHICEDYEEYKLSHGQGSLSFSSLQDLKMNSLHFGRDLKYPVCAALAGREKAGCRLKKLVISAGEVSEDSVKQLMRYIDEVQIPASAITKTKSRRIGST